jgi:hypothetical protein
MPEKKREQLDMDTSVAPGADVGDALRDLTPDEFTSLMSELGYELFGPKDPRPTAGQMRRYANTPGYIDDPMWGAAYSLTRSTQPEARGFAGNPDPIPGTMREAEDSDPVTKSAYDEMVKNSPNALEAFIQGGPIGVARRPYSVFNEFLNEVQKRLDPNYPEDEMARKKARMEALKARVRERMARFKL